MDRSDYLQSERLLEAGFTHAFFTRRGGVSGGPFASLNLSPEVGDASEHVGENLRRAAALLGVLADRLYVTRQVHGAAVLVIDGMESAAAVAARPADASVSSAAHIACAVRTADCLPLLLADTETGRVAAVHAGWRGVAQNIAGACVAQMAALGSRPEALLAAIGPHVSVAAFEIGEEVARELERAPGASGAISRRAGQKPHADLARIVQAQLARAGVSSHHIERVVGCTVTDEHSFYSYRRQGAVSGRMLSAIVPRRGLDAAHSGAAGNASSAAASAAPRSDAATLPSTAKP